ncbi:unnamed protein product [Cunninghamella blakesleeana]
MSLFPTPQRYLVQFNAGRCIREGNLLKPDIRKGMIYMEKGDDQLLHFFWKERKTNSAPEVDYIIFPDEAELVRVPECTTGRVIQLKFKSSNERHFYWMQKRDDSEDDELIERVNHFINNPSSMDDGMDLDSADQSIDMDLMQRLMGSAEQGDFNEDNLRELIQASQSNMEHRDSEQDTIMNDTTSNGTNEQSTTTQATVASSTNTIQTDVNTQLQSESSTNDQPSSSQPPSSTNVNPEYLDQLRSMLAGIQPQGRSSIQLGDVLNNKTLTKLLDDSSVCESFYSLLPDGSEHSPYEVRQVIKSPQFQQSLRSLSTALQSGQLGPLITQFGLDPSAGNGVEAFLKAIEDQARKKDEKN